MNVSCAQQLKAAKVRKLVFGATSPFAEGLAAKLPICHFFSGRKIEPPAPWETVSVARFALGMSTPALVGPAEGFPIRIEPVIEKVAALTALAINSDSAILAAKLPKPIVILFTSLLPRQMDRNTDQAW